MPLPAPVTSAGVLVSVGMLALLLAALAKLTRFTNITPARMAERLLCHAIVTIKK
jgi:hypothetical protein